MTALIDLSLYKNITYKNIHKCSQMCKYNIGLKTVLQEGRSETVFYGDLGYMFRKIVGKTDFWNNLKRVLLATKL